MKFNIIEDKEDPPITYKEASDPESKWYDEYWYENYDVPPEHEWFDIIGRFLNYKLRISEIKNELKNAKLKDKSKITHRIKLSLEKLDELIPMMEFFIRNQEHTGHFADTWGDFNKYYDMLNSSFSQDKILKKAGKQGKEATNVDKQRQWFALWVAYYMENGKEFIWAKRYFLKILQDIKSKKRSIPNGFPVKWITKILTKNRKSLKSTYQNKISEEKIREMVAKPIINPSLLPPVGEESYPEK